MKPGFRTTPGQGRARCFYACSIGALVLALGLGARTSDEPLPAIAAATAVDFNRDIRPILSNNCFQCHGPDAAARKAGLRFDLRDDAITPLESGAVAIAPGDPANSELLRRVTTLDPLDRMPPPESDKTLTAEQIDTLRRWIESGAEYQRHWSFEPVARDAPPQVGDESWCRDDIDRFILARLESEGLDPSPAASREALLRRVTLDLTGLPPTLEEIDAFLTDWAPDAYERVVDRLLASERYGEHMARYWLDLARYGDTHGLHLDNAREMWPWRDWVIHAFNNNMPYDRFSIEQIAGDMLPEATRDQIIATGFNRNHVSTNEGGVIAQEFQVKNVADRAETTSTVWMGLTLNCAQCHDHKFDPVTQREYYELFAFFNNTTENPLDGNRRDWAPIMRAPSPEQSEHLDALVARIATVESELDAPNPAIDADEERWRTRLADAWSSGWTPLDEVSARSESVTLRPLGDGSFLAEGTPADRDVYEFAGRIAAAGNRTIRLEALTHDDLPHRGPGLAENANFVLSEIEAEAVSLADPSRTQTVTFVAAAADHEQLNGPYPVAAAIDGVVSDTNGWAVEGFNRRENRTAVFVAAEPFGFEGGSELRVRLRFQTHFPRHAIGRARLSVGGEGGLYEAVAPLGTGTWHAAGPFPAGDRERAFAHPFGPENAPGTFDAAEVFEEGLAWEPHPEWTDGAPHMLTGEMCATYLARTIHAPTARTTDLHLGTDDAVKLWVNGRLVHENNVARALAADQDTVSVELHPGENTILMKVVNFSGGYGFAFRIGEGDAGGELLRIIPLVTAQERSAEEATRLRRYFRRNHSERMRELYDDLASLRAERDAFEAALPFTMVMEEREERRPTHVLQRGEYDQPRDEVLPGVPAALPPITARDEGSPPDRLDLARWLFHPDHPLTARVTVNRFWQQLFGTGIVKTAEDFGSQGQWPSHPELLDHLAADFIESGWDVKRLLRRLVTSATYRQTSAVTEELLARDPDNRLLARGPRHRLDAEVIRDQALFAGALLVERIGGPGVKPYQPEGLWRAVAYPDSNTQMFTMDEGEALYRRSMYTYWKRTSHPPNLAAFDAPNRETCTVRRPRTNTPLQVLVLLNDPQFVEAARAIGARALREESETDARLATLFRLLTSRAPEAGELTVLRDLFLAERDRYAGDPAAAEALLDAGQSPRDGSLDPAEHAAMTNVATAILALDEAITKG